jgi:hypothetical protein
MADPSTDYSPITKLSDDQILAMLKAQAGVSGRPTPTMADVADVRKNPGNYAGSNVGGTYVPGTGGIGNQVQGGMNFLDYARMAGTANPNPAAAAPAAQTSSSTPSYLTPPQIQAGGGGVDDQTAINFWRQQAIASGDQNPGNIDAATAQQFYANTHPQTQDNTQPETRALAQLAQIDPTSEALRNQLGQSYLSTLSRTPTPTFTPGQAPKASDVQGYLDLYKQIDPEGYAQRAGLATSMDAYLKQVQAQNALGAQLDPSTQREVSQAARQAQAARGNIYGTPQLVAETMQRGSAGEARLQQRQAALGTALGQQQGYLSSGQGLGDIANTLYGQGFSRNMSQYQQQLAALNQAQGAAQGYLGSGTTPYQAGASYLGNAQQTAASAAQGGPQYNPASLSPGMTGTAQQAPQYGLDTGAQSQNYYQAMTYGQAMQPQPQNNTASYIGAAANVAGSLAKAYAK